MTIDDPTFWNDDDRLGQITRQLLEARWRHKQVADANRPARWIVGRTGDGFNHLDLWYPQQLEPENELADYIYYSDDD